LRCGGRQDDGEYLSLSQVARIIHVGRTTVWEIVVARSEIPYFRISERIVRIRRSDVDAYLKARRLGATR
jgi:excisionase family DNA binding protein